MNPPLHLCSSAPLRGPHFSPLLPCTDVPQQGQHPESCEVRNSSMRRITDAP